jgi:N-methylhydantoinase A
MTAKSSFLVGVDVGGTFTDLLVHEEQSGWQTPHKVPSTPDDPSRGVFEGLRVAASGQKESLEAFLRNVPLIVHGTTVATNAVLTGRGAKTGLLTTGGLRDILEMRRGVRDRRHLYDNKYVAPPPLVPRHLRMPVGERIDLAGKVVKPFEPDSVREAVEVFKREQVQSVAVCFMHSYANPQHEQEAKRLVEELMPNCFLCISSEVLPQVRLYNRVSTTAMNAYLGPVVHRYMERLVERLEEAGFQGVLLIMQSNGGVATPETVALLPASIVLSGPAAGPVAALAYAKERQSKSCIVIDMGGTSFDASLVRNGEIEVTREGEVNRQLIALPMIAIHTIGAGGGSIAWLDEGGILRVGPASAGADPGPAAYGRGGREPTVTDTDLLLGYLSPEQFLGGRMRLLPELAEAAINERIAQPLGLDVISAAAGIYEVVNLVMAAGVKDISVQRGYDPREFPLVVAGGAGPVHAAMIAQELGIDLLIIPRLAPVFCALGMLIADLRHDYVQAFSRVWHELDLDEARDVVASMESRGMNALEQEGVPEERRDVVVAADMRYVGQHHEVTVPFAFDLLNHGDGKGKLAGAFHRRHDELYGFALPTSPLEIINLRTTVLGRRGGVSLKAGRNGKETGSPPPKGQRPTYVHSEQRLVGVDVFDGELMAVGNQIVGPAIIEEATTTVVVPEDFDVVLDQTGSFVMYRKGRRPALTL